MNVSIDNELIQDSMKIETGVRKLQSKIAHVIDRNEPDRANADEVLARNRRDLEDIKADLRDFIQRQKEFCKLISQTQKEVAMMNEEIHLLRSQTESLKKVE